jgi:hypothetical protein
MPEGKNPAPVRPFAEGAGILRPCCDTPARWAKGFLANVAADPTASRAWRGLCEAGLDRAALYPLWKYAHSDSEFEKLRKDAKRMAN